MESLHTQDHGHEDPAVLLAKLLAERALEPRTWNDADGGIWVLEREEEAEGARAVLSLLRADGVLVCQAWTNL